MRAFKYIAFSLIALTACETDANIDLQNLDPLLVANGIAKNGEVFELELSQTKSSNDTTSFTFVNNATAILMKEGIVVDTLTMVADSNAYYSDFNLTPGSYDLVVNSPDYPNITSSTIIPNVINYTVENIEYITDSTYNEWTGDYDYFDGYNFDLVFQDDASTTDFYLFESFNGYLETESIFIDGGNAEESYKGGFKLTANDGAFNGQNMRINMFVESYGINDPQLNGFVMYRLSEDYYKYYKSARAHQNAVGNPFAEYVEVYNNIQDGVGIFAGMTEGNRTN